MNPNVRRGLTAAAILLALAALAIPKLVSFDAAPKVEAASPSEEAVLEVSAYRVHPERLVETLSTTGTIRANERIDVVSEVAGKVREVLFEEGVGVEAGELLVKIDDVELRAERERIVFRLELAEQRERRQNELLDEGVTSQDDYDLALSELNVLRAELRLLEAQLEKTEIRAPFSGIVGLRRISPGSYLSPQTLITTLQDVDPVKLDFNVPERYAGEVGVGGEVSFRVKGSADAQVAQIYAVEPTVDPETRSLVLRARSPNPKAQLLPGAFADVEVTVREVPGALTVPSIAVVPELGGKKVFVFEDGVARERRIKTGLRTPVEVEVLEGLEAGDLVLTSGLLSLKEGMAIELAEISESARESPAAPSGVAAQVDERGEARP